MKNHTIEENNNIGRRSKNAKNRQYMALIGVVSSLILVVGVVAVYSAFNIYKPSIKTDDTEISSSTISSTIFSSASDDTSSEVHDEEWEKQHRAHSPNESYYVIPGDSNEENKTYKSVGFTKDEFDTIVLAVQHEVGINPDYYPNCEDFDKIQQMMARVIINRVGQPGFGATLEEVLKQPGQFPGLLEDISHYQSLPNANQYDLYDTITRANVEAVMNGTDDLTGYIYFERCSLPGQTTIEEAWAYARSQFLSPTIQLYWYEETKDGRFIMFISNTNGAY